MFARRGVDVLIGPVIDGLSHPLYGGPAVLVVAAVLYPFGTYLYWILAVVGASIPFLLSIMRNASPVPIVNWWDEIVLVTGGTSGIGLALVKQLLAEKKPKKVVVLGLQTIDLSDKRLISYECDITDVEQIQRTAAKLLSEVGQPTMIVNNAGIVGVKAFEEKSDKEFSEVLTVNLLGPMRVVKALLPGLRRLNRGHIVNVSSALGFIGVSHLTDYCASKAGLLGFTDSLREELRQGTRIKVSSICPGLVQTSMFDGLKYRMPVFTPPLKADDVASTIVKILNDNRSVALKLPISIGAMPVLRFLPVEFQALICDIFGTNSSIRSFRRE
ncbi:hypothetical protein DFJ73DRAFT_545890 [Zopfochytrium polystomum]|nr:hypothetical protein DFJ73DRAFT_545890 [Zopfochytrium polystomum]